jgi:hypothetical protein
MGGGRVHRFEIQLDDGADPPAAFPNGLDGEIVAIVPDTTTTSLAQVFWSTRKIDVLLVVERTPESA